MTGFISHLRNQKEVSKMSYMQILCMHAYINIRLCFNLAQKTQSFDWV